MDLAQRTNDELKTLKANAEKLLTDVSRKEAAENLLQRIEIEEKARRGRRGENTSKNFKWRGKSPIYTLFNGNQPIAYIRKDANHSQSMRDAYSAEIFGKRYRRFEHIEAAKKDVAEKALREFLNQTLKRK
jgi:hypothetical protein